VEEDHRWYVAVSGSAAQVEEADQRIANAPAAGSTLVGRNDMETGAGWAIAFGRSLGSFRAEVEYGRTDSESDSFRIVSPITATLQQEGEVDVSRVMLNGYYDFGAEDWRLRPFVGLGGGYAEVSLLRIAGLANNPSAPPFKHIDDESSGFAWQVMGGAAWALIPDRLSLTAQYRYLDAGGFEGRDFRGQAVHSETAVHSLDLGLRWRF
jgi:opacity protein-like surface antigen